MISSSPTSMLVWQVFTANGTWTGPAGMTGTPAVYAWGESGTGGISTHGVRSGPGSGAGAIAGEPALGGVVQGTVLTITVPQGGTGNPTTVTGGAVAISAAAGGSATALTAGLGGAAGSNTVAFKGGDGAGPISGATANGAGGGGSAGSTGAGGNAVTSTGGTAGTGPAGPPSLAGAAGQSGAGSSSVGADGAAPGGGASGGGSGGSLNHNGGAAARGQVIVIWAVALPPSGSPLFQGRPARKARPGMHGTPGSPVYSPGPPVAPPPPAYGPLRQKRPGRRGPQMHGARGIVTPTAPGPPVPPPPPAKGPVRQKRPGRRTPFLQGDAGIWSPVPAQVVNQWRGTFAQPAAFSPMPPALQSTVTALTPANSVGGGTGVPSAGNWLFCLVGINEQSTASGATVAATDDIHSFWRPGNVETSTWAVSTKLAETRTSVWYTPNLSRSPGDVYAAPNGCVAGMACLIVEVAGLGPWDVVTGISSGYVAASMALTLALGAPPAQAFVLAAACGDSTAAGQSLAPPGWNALQTVTASNGADHSCDTVLTAACVTANSPVSVSATAASATDMSGVIIGVLSLAPSPVPANWNPVWPYIIYEAAFGSGYETPPDEMTWTQLNNAAGGGFQRRFWSTQDTSGVPYALGQLQSSTGTTQLDNIEGALSPSNSASPYFPHVAPGTPVRLRAAIATIKGVTCNRWYILQRNALGWPEQRTRLSQRNFVPLSTTDVMSVVAGSPPSPYRAEVMQDIQAAQAAGGTAWWWPCDDQPLSGGVLPTSLRNAAPGNSTALQIIASPSGVSSQDAYSTTGVDLTSQVASFGSAVPPPGIASYEVAQLSGWGYGDPQSSPASATAGGPVTASPGSAAWQQTGLLGNTGNAGWALTATGTFPPLASGVTLAGWYNYGFAGGAAGCGLGSNFYDVAAQPACPLTLFELATGTGPVAVLQLDTSGHLSLATYNGGTGTSHAIYSGSDLRASGFFMYSVRLTQSTFEVKVNAGLTADVSGAATISASAWSWIVANGDLGSNGGSSAGTGLVHGGNVAISHLVILPGLLPAYRELSWYQAMITGFGVLPAPSGLQLSAVSNPTQGGGSTPDGSEFQGQYGFVSSVAVTSYTFSAVAAAAAGAYTSGPSARAVTAGIGQSGVSPHIGAAVWAGWNALAPLVQVFTAASADAETEAAACLGSGDSFTSGFGAGASGHGVCQVTAGTGASPPAAPSALGDQLGQRIERLLGNGGITQPMRAIDQEPLQVQAALDTGGSSVGSSVQNMVSSGSGLLYVGTDGYLRYRAKAHLAADTAVWLVGMDVANGYIPFADDITWENDPTKIWDVIQASPYSPDGAVLPLVTPANATAEDAAQVQFGPRPNAYTSYLQSQGSIQNQADWLFANFGKLLRRVQNITINAATHPAAWPMVLNGNCGEIVQVHDAPYGQPATIGTYRISRMSRTIAFGANGNGVTAELKLTMDPVPSSYW